MAARWRYFEFVPWIMVITVAAANPAMSLTPTGVDSAEILCRRVPSPCGAMLSDVETTDSSSQRHANHWRYGRYVVALTAGAAIFAFDKDLNDISRERYLHSSGADAIFRHVPNLGTRGPYAVSVPLLVGYGLVFKDRKYVVAGGELVAGLVLVEGVTQAAKGAFGRKRPFQTDSPYHFFESGTSFFSGHSSSVMTYATIMAKNFPRQDLSVVGIDREVPLVPILVYSVAGMVMAHRLYTNVHWASDVYTGAMVGYGVGALMVHLGRRFSRASVMVIPGETPMVSIAFRYGG